MPINDHLTMRSMDIVYLFRKQRAARSDTLLTFSCVKSIKFARVGSERTLTTTFRGLLKIVHLLATLNVVLIYRSTRIMVLGAILALCLLTPSIVSSQFPTVRNTQESLQSKTCCPNECGGPTRGTCRNISSVAATQAQTADQAVINILQAASEEPQKGTADSRYLWPTVVFERVCVYNSNYGGYDCNECDFGWTGSDCATKKVPVIRKGFARLSAQEKEIFINATRDLKREMGRWSVIVEEPLNYTTGTVKLQDVTTYNFFVFLHDFVARDSQAGGVCTKQVDMNILIDFAHSGPVFPVWHGRYILTVEKEFQRITGNSSFGFPYWQWEQNDRSAFTEEYCAFQ